MNYENYIELYEAVYFFRRITNSVENKINQLICKEDVINLGLDESIYNAVIRILVVNDLLDYDGTSLSLTKENIDKQQHVLDEIINKDPYKEYTILYKKALNDTQFFFDDINECEYDIYSRCNFDLTFRTGKEVVKQLDFSNEKVLELGGNSGGLATALIGASENCVYTVFDTKIPCAVGNEFKALNGMNMTFIEGNIFDMKLSNNEYDSIIIMNLLHDFDDNKCLDILRNSIKHCHNKTKFIIIEDILIEDFEPKEVIMHGLRLSAECRGGKQRTIKEFNQLFLHIDYKVEHILKLNEVHRILVIGAR